jgi:hypothetical protein
MYVLRVVQNFSIFQPPKLDLGEDRLATEWRLKERLLASLSVDGKVVRLGTDWEGYEEGLWRQSLVGPCYLVIFMFRSSSFFFHTPLFPHQCHKQIRVLSSLILSEDGLGSWRLYAASIGATKLN